MIGGQQRLHQYCTFMRKPAWSPSTYGCRIPFNFSASAFTRSYNNATCSLCKGCKQSLVNSGKMMACRVIQIAVPEAFLFRQPA